MSTVYECNGLSYELEEGAASVIGTTRKDFKELTVPGELTYEGVTYPVKSIKKAAFAALDQLESISLPFIGSDDSVARETLFGYIFGSSEYARVIPGDRVYDTPDTYIVCDNYQYVPKSLKTVYAGGSLIGKQAFRGCSSIERVVIADTVEGIEYDAFAGCSSLKSITVPGSVGYIGSEAFKDCTSLVSVNIENGLKNIWAKAFENCTALTDVSLPDTIRMLDNTAFDGCKKLKCNCFYNARYLGNEKNPYLVLLSARDKTITSCRISKKTRIISNRAFYGCAAITEINIPKGVISIGDEAFEGCKGLTKLSLPATLESIGSFAFQGTSSIEGVLLPQGISYIGSCAFRWSGPVYVREETAPESWDRNWNMSNYQILYGHREKTRPEKEAPTTSQKGRKTWKKR